MSWFGFEAFLGVQSLAGHQLRVVSGLDPYTIQLRWKMFANHPFRACLGSRGSGFRVCQSSPCRCKIRHPRPFCITCLLCGACQRRLFGKEAWVASVLFGVVCSWVPVASRKSLPSVLEVRFWVYVPCSLPATTT